MVRIRKEQRHVLYVDFPPFHGLDPRRSPSLSPGDSSPNGNRQDSLGEAAKAKHDGSKEAEERWIGNWIGKLEDGNRPS